MFFSKKELIIIITFALIILITSFVFEIEFRFANIFGMCWTLLGIILIVKSYFLRNELIKDVKFIKKSIKLKWENFIQLVKDQKKK